ncbi:iron-containing alcohol dehydrogenase [Candidatus Aerophobetes bacterium]|nr:iron-containing alcohol dehydrogenase [Candidatus Aerophobetes bacterium]
MKRYFIKDQTQGGDIEDYREERKIIKGPLLPILAVPTTSGTGSEVTPYSVFTSGKAKFAVRSPFTFPRVAILDPLLMASQSPYLTACTGMDALTHAVEAFVSRSAQPISDALAAQAIYLISRNLRKAVWTGDDIQARENMAVASNLAGMAIAQAGAGAAHGLGMVVGGFFDTDHGSTVGLLLPYIMEYNLSARLEKYAQVAYLMGERVEALSLREAALKAVSSVKNLIKDINLPSTLSEIGVRRESIDEMAKETLKQGAMKKNPKVMQIEDILELYQKCI